LLRRCSIFLCAILLLSAGFCPASFQKDTGDFNGNVGSPVSGLSLGAGGGVLVQGGKSAFAAGGMAALDAYLGNVAAHTVLGYGAGKVAGYGMDLAGFSEEEKQAVEQVVALAGLVRGVTNTTMKTAKETQAAIKQINTAKLKEVIQNKSKTTGSGSGFAQASRRWTALDNAENSGQNFVLVGQGELSNKVPTSGSWFKADGSPHWPRNAGFVGIPIQGEIAVGARIDRYGGRYVDGVFQDFGGFTAPAGASFTSRALPASSRNLPLSTYEVLKPFNVEAGPARQWFGERGLGTQFQHAPIQDLIDGRYLRLINRQ
jgi:hypothetical protein